MKVWIRSNRCTVFIPGSVLVGVHVCVCTYVFRLWHKDTEGAQLGRASVYSMRTWEHLGLILYICTLAQRSQTNVHIVQLTAATLICVLWQLSPFHFLSCLDSTFLFESPHLNRTEQKRGVKRSAGCVRPRDRIKLSWRCFWKVLLRFNRLWESLDPAILLRSLVQDLQGWTVRKTNSIICPHTFPAVFYIHLWRVEVWGGTLKADAEKGRWKKKRTV